MAKRLTERLTSRAFLKACGVILAGAGAGQLVIPPKPAFADDGSFYNLAVSNKAIIGAGGVPDQTLYVAGLVGVGSDVNYRATVASSYIQLGNNATNRIIAGRAADGGGSLEVVVNNRGEGYSGGTVVATFASNGLVGIGATPDASYRLRVGGSLGVGATYITTVDWNFVQMGNNGSNYLIAGRLDYYGGALEVVVNQRQSYQSGDPTGTVAATFAANGCVGIGTRQPSERLELSGGNLKVSNGSIYGGSKLLANAYGCVYA